MGQISVLGDGKLGKWMVGVAAWRGVCSIPPSCALKMVHFMLNAFDRNVKNLPLVRIKAGAHAAPWRLLTLQVHRPGRRTHVSAIRSTQLQKQETSPHPAAVSVRAVSAPGVPSANLPAVSGSQGSWGLRPAESPQGDERPSPGGWSVMPRECRAVTGGSHTCGEHSITCESPCCAPETSVTLSVRSTSIKKKRQIPYFHSVSWEEEKQGGVTLRNLGPGGRGEASCGCGVGTGRGGGGWRLCGGQHPETI